MVRKYIIIICTGLLGLAQMACKKDKMLSYDLSAGIAFYKDGISAGRDSMTISFAVMTETTMSDTIELPLRIVGQPVNYDRPVQVNVDSERSTGSPNTYKLLSAMVPADSYEGIMRIRVDRTEELREKEAKIWLQLEETADFNVGPHELSTYLIKVNDFLSRPPSWHDVRFGEYSQVKYGLIIRETGYSDFTSLHPEVLFYIVAKCRNALDTYQQTHGEEMLDENQLPIRFP